MTDVLDASVGLVIAAAGVGRRMGGVDKALLRIRGKTLVENCLDNLGGYPGVCAAIIVGHRGCVDEIRSAVGQHPRCFPVEVVEGGPTRAESVDLGLKSLGERGDFVAIHDAARPFASGDLLRRLVEAAKDSGGAIPGLPVTDTIKSVAAGGSVDDVVTTLDRSLLRAIQTPQVFRRDLIIDAYEVLSDRLGEFTDDASLLEERGHRVVLVDGEEENVKFTSRRDLLSVDSPSNLGGLTRTGIGYDSHRLVAGRPLILGGVRIHSPRGLMGHSDADVLYHAITDALLGAAALGDIGSHFPPSDPRYSGMDSARILSSAVGMLREKGYRPVNVDSTVVLEQPRLSPYIEDMRKNISRITGMPPVNVSVKAKTDEGMGPIGRMEGAAAWAICSIATLEEASV